MKKTQSYSLILFFKFKTKIFEYIYIYINKNKKPMWDEIKEKDNDNKVRKPNINQILNGNS